MINKLSKLATSLKRLGLTEYAGSIDKAVKKIAQETEYDSEFDPDLDPDIQELRRERERYQEERSGLGDIPSLETREPITPPPVESRELVDRFGSVLEDLETYVSLAVDYLKPKLETDSEYPINKDDSLLQYATYVAESISNFIDPENGSLLHPQMLTELGAVTTKKNKELFDYKLQSIKGLSGSYLSTFLIDILKSLYERKYQEKKEDTYLSERSELIDETPAWHFRSRPGREQYVDRETGIARKYREE